MLNLYPFIKQLKYTLGHICKLKPPAVSFNVDIQFSHNRLFVFAVLFFALIFLLPEIYSKIRCLPTVQKFKIDLLLYFYGDLKFV